jgi:hypothetical protein
LPPVASSVSNVSVSLDGTPVELSAIQYAGVTPLPAGLPSGDHTITMSVNGICSPTGPYISTRPTPL